MSGSFWKFGQDFSNESPISTTLNRAFIKRDEDSKDLVPKVGNDNELKKEQHNEPYILSPGHDEEEDHEGEKSFADKPSLPTEESEYVNYRPNLDVIDELLDDEELYTELMCSNFKLLIYLKYPEVLSKLIDYVTNEEVLEDTASRPKDSTQETVEDYPESKEELVDEQNGTSENKVTDNDAEEDSASHLSEETSVTLPPEVEEQAEIRRARMAAEILSADVWPISSALIENGGLLERLWDILDRPAPLSIAASTYFMKINERLLDMDLNGMLSFILSQNNLVARFLAHVDNPPLMDFLLKVISTDKPDAPTGIITELKEQGLIPQLLDRLEPEYNSSTQSAVGDFLKAFITISANSSNEIASVIGPNELTRQLVSSEMMEKLIKIMLKGGTSLNNGVGVIIELIRKNNSDYDFVQVVYTTLATHPPNDRDPIYLGHLVKAFASYIPDFKKILTDTKLPSLETPFGTIEPLGFERFKICELVAELLHCSNMTLQNELNGEAIVKERDEERERLLSFAKKTNQSNINTNSDDIIKTIGTSDVENFSNEKPTITDITEELDSLDMNKNQVDNNDSDSNASAKELNDAQSVGSTDTMLSEEALRKNPLPGDQLKIILHDTGIISTILDMFFSFAWNNFMHNVVFDIVQQIFNGPLKTGYNKYLLIDLLTNAHITDLIIEGERKCAQHEEETGLRLGYMGHLTLIAEEVAKFSTYLEEIDFDLGEPAVIEILNEPSWVEYTETVLAETREKYNTILGDFADAEDDSVQELDEEDNFSVATGNNEDDYDVVEYNNEESDQLVQNSDLYSGADSGEAGEYFDEYNKVDSPRYYEYTDGSNTKLEFDPHMLKDNASEHYSEGLTNNDKNGANDNKFSEYMSEQLGTNFNMVACDNASDEGEYQFKNGSAAELENDYHDDPHWPQKSAAFALGVPKSQYEDDDDDDDYMDPNDDGQSYAKPSHLLYSNSITPTASHRVTPGSGYNRHLSLYNEEDDISDESDAELEKEDDAYNNENQRNVEVTTSKENSISDEDSDDTSADEDDSPNADVEGGDSSQGCRLYRSTSKDNLAWDENEQDRLMEMVNYNRQHSGL